MSKKIKKDILNFQDIELELCKLEPIHNSIIKRNRQLTINEYKELLQSHEKIKNMMKKIIITEIDKKVA